MLIQNPFNVAIKSYPEISWYENVSQVLQPSQNVDISICMLQKEYCAS